MKLKLDFIIIGAQKAGTTSIARYLSESQDIFIPSQKELPFFLEKSLQDLDWDGFCRIYFKGAKKNQLIGTSTPQYMMYPESFQYIQPRFPKVKLIAILRDPISRLISHFDMATRFRVETRDLNTAVENHLKNINFYRNTPFPDETGKYIVAGEYGRILEKLYEHFDQSQVIILQFDDIKNDPQKVINNLCIFLGIPSFSPKNLNSTFMRGGSKKKIPIDHDRILSWIKVPFRSMGLSGLFPKNFKAKIDLLSSRIDELNVDPTSKTEVQNFRAKTLDHLKEHFIKDSELLEKMGIQVPWKAKLYDQHSTPVEESV